MSRCGSTAQRSRRRRTRSTCRERPPHDARRALCSRSAARPCSSVICPTTPASAQRIAGPDADRPVRRRLRPARLVDGRGRRAAARRRSQRHGRRRDYARRAGPRARTAAGPRARHAHAWHGHQDRTAGRRGDGGQRPSRFRRRRARGPRGGDSHRHGPGQRRFRGARAAERSARDDRARRQASVAGLDRSDGGRRAAAPAARGLRELRERADRRDAVDADRLPRKGDRARSALRSRPARAGRRPGGSGELGGCPHGRAGGARIVPPAPARAICGGGRGAEPPALRRRVHSDGSRWSTEAPAPEIFNNLGCRAAAARRDTADRQGDLLLQQGG